MKAYDESLIWNAWARQQARAWAERGLLTTEEEQSVRQTYAETPYRPNWYIWIGLFLFTFPVLSSGLYFFLPFVDLPYASAFLGPVYAVAIYFLLSYLIKKRQLYFSGIDNAALYFMVLCFTPTIGEWADRTGADAWLIGLAFLPLLLFAAYRYGEPLLALAAFLNGGFILAALMLETSGGRLVLPFVLMLYAGVVWFSVEAFRKKEGSFYWQIALRTVHIGALALLYAACNYFVVREGNAVLSDVAGESPQIPMAGLFWVLTFAVPLLYLVIAFFRKSLDFLYVGVVLFVLSLLTLYHYYPLVPGAWATGLLGLAGILGAVLMMKYFKVPKQGFVYEPNEKSELAIFAETVLTTQVGARASDSPTGPRLGGGDFGGGGSGDRY